MSLSPQGSTARTTGSLRKGLPVMMLAGLLAWLAGEAWSIEPGSGDAFQLLMVFGTIAGLSIPAQLIAGPRARPWLLATLGTTGFGVPWFFGIAVAREGQDVLIVSLTVVLAVWLIAFASCLATRRVVGRTLR